MTEDIHQKKPIIKVIGAMIVLVFLGLVMYYSRSGKITWNTSDEIPPMHPQIDLVFRGNIDGIRTSVYTFQVDSFVYDIIYDAAVGNMLILNKEKVNNRMPDRVMEESLKHR